MKDRDSILREIRPQLASVPGENKRPEESFQNNTLRPILKFQNDLLIELFRNYLRKHKTDFSNLSPEKQLAFIANATQKDMKFRNSLKGVVIGFFTLEEYQYYQTNSSNINKRIIQLVTERLEGNVQLFAAAPIDQGGL